MSRFLRDKPAAEPARQGRSVYADRFRDDSEDGDRWVTVAESDAGAALRWVPGWERRVQGWVPLEEVLRR